MPFVIQVDYGIGTDLAIRELIHEAFAGRAVNPESSGSCRSLSEVESDAHSFFLRRIPGAALNPVLLDLRAADTGGFSPEFACRAGLIRRIEFRRELRVILCPELHIRTETAVAKHHSLRRLDVFHLSGIGFREAVAIPHLESLYATVRVADDRLHVAAGTDFDTLFR